MKPTLLYSSEQCEVWHGDSLDRETAETVMSARTITNPGGHMRVAQLLHADAPYSERTHQGHADGKMTADSLAEFAASGSTPLHRYAAKRAARREDIAYESWDAVAVHHFVDCWAPHVFGWVTTITDSELARPWSESFTSRGLYTFPRLAWVEMGGTVRMSGDGPASWTRDLIVARPRSKPWNKWGALPGAYVGPAENHQNRPERITGGKSLRMTAAFVSDYSHPGDLVLDPCFGGATTGLACLMTGRRVIGVEIDEARAEACARLMRDGRVKVPEKQEALF